MRIKKIDYRYFPESKFNDFKSKRTLRVYKVICLRSIYPHMDKPIKWHLVRYVEIQLSNNMPPHRDLAYL